MNMKSINSLEEMQMPSKIGNEDEYRKYIKILNDNATYINNKSLENKAVNDVNNLVDLLEAYDGKTMFIIQYTNNTTEILGFSDSEQALEYAYSDHLLKCSPLKRLLV
jgi:hypothetical protein